MAKKNKHARHCPHCHSKHPQAAKEVTQGLPAGNPAEAGVASGPGFEPEAATELFSPLPDHVAQSPTPAAAVEKPRYRYWLHGALAAVVVGLCAIMYGWTSDFPMVFDDGVYLQNNPLLTDASSFGYLADFREFANKPGKMGLELDLATNFILRPVAYATFHLNYLLDGFNPRWYRVFNIVVHMATSILIYALFSFLLSRSTKGLSLSRQSVTFISATTALLFACHPLATESVTYIAQRFTSLGAFFYILVLLLHFRANEVQTRARRWVLRGAAFIAVVLGMLTKECNFTVPLMAVMLDWLIMGSTLKKSLHRATALLLCLPLIPVQVMLVSWAQNDGVFTLNHSINLTNLKDLPWNHWDYVVTQLTVILSYLRRLFWPADMNIDPEWPLYQSLLQGPVLLALGVFTAMIVGSWLLYRRYRQDTRFACIFAFTLWFFGTIVISSGLVPLPDLMAEHRAYLPSLGIFAAVACILDRLRTSRLAGRSARILVPVVAIVCATAFSYTTFQRNKVWSTRIGLWEDTVAKSPGKYRAWNNLGAAYQASGKYDEAMSSFKRAKELEPRYEVPYLNTAICLNILNRNKEALDELNSLIKVSVNTGKNLDVQYQYGLALLGIGQVDKGMNLLQKIAEAVPEHRPSHVMVGFVYSRNNMPRRALKYWKQAVALGEPSPELAKLIKQTEAQARKKAKMD
jgi:hypothetical protein